MSDKNPHWIMKNRDGKFAKMGPHGYVVWRSKFDDATLLDRDGLLKALQNMDAEHAENDVITIERAL